MRSVAVVMLLVSLWSVAAGQEQMRARSAQPPPLSLAQLEAAAMQGNAEIRTAVRRVAVAQAKVPGAGALDDPMLQYRNWGTPLERPYDLNQAQNMFMIAQAFPGPGKRAARSQVAGKEVEVAREQLEATRREVQVQVRKAFYDLLRNADELRLHDEQMQLTRQALASARAKYTVGLVPQQDVLKAQIAITRLQEHLIMLEEQGDMARAALNTLMGRDPASPMEVEGRYSTPTQVPPLAQLEQLAIANRPELRAIAAQQKVAEARANLAGKTYTPDFTVGVGYMLMPEGAMSRNNYMAEFSLNLPWLNRRKHEAELGEARAMTEEARAEYEMQRTNVGRQIQEAVLKVRSAQRVLELYRDTLRPQATATFRAAAAAYQHDRTDFLNLVDSQNMLLDVESSYYRTAADLDTRIAELERAIGTALPGRESAGNGVQQ